MNFITISLCNQYDSRIMTILWDMFKYWSFSIWIHLLLIFRYISLLSLWQKLWNQCLTSKHDIGISIRRKSILKKKENLLTIFLPTNILYLIYRNWKFAIITLKIINYLLTERNEIKKVAQTVKYMNKDILIYFYDIFDRILSNKVLDND